MAEVRHIGTAASASDRQFCAAQLREFADGVEQGRVACFALVAAVGPAVAGIMRVTEVFPGTSAPTATALVGLLEVEKASLVGLLLDESVWETREVDETE